MTEKRSQPRIQPFVAPCLLLYGERRVSGYLIDLGVGGAQVACDQVPPPEDTPVVIEVRFPALLRPSPTAEVAPTRLPGRVRWSGTVDTGHACGITFAELSDHERSIVEGVIEQMQRRAAQLS